MSDGDPSAIEPPASASSTSAQRVASASFWAGLGFGARFTIRLGGNLVFARLLFPEAFGLMAIINAIRTGLGMFSDLGIAPSVVQSKRGDEAVFLDTAWTMQIIRGALLAAVALAFAGPLSRYYGRPELHGMLAWTSTALLLAGFNSMSMAQMQRRMAIRGIEVVMFSGQVASVAVVLVWLLIEPTVWALVAGTVAASFVRLIASHAIADRRARLRWDPGSAREIFRFGRWITLSTALTFFADQADRLILGRLADLAQLGVYSIAAMLAALPAILVNSVGTLAVFPALSRSRQTSGDFSSAYARARRPIVALGGLIVASILVAANPLISILYDPRYADTGWMLQVLIVGTWFRILESPPRAALLALGETHWLAALNGVKLVSVVVGLPVGFTLGGIAGGLGALVAGDVLRFIVCSVGAKRQGLRSFAGDMGVTLATAIAAVVGAAVASALKATGASQVVLLFAGAGGALGAFAPVALFLLHRSNALGLLRFRP
ncbi:MAG: oligosaccharide flippase family protein [bacterium]|nr:oligosaccharide flippase family protein [bacterium]